MALLPRIAFALPSALLLVVSAGAVGFQLSCAGPKACERNSDCDHAYCSNGECKQDCIVASVDCPPGYVCNQVAQCALPGDAGVPDGEAGSGGDGGTAGSSGSGGSTGSGGSGGTAGSTDGGAGSDGSAGTGGASPGTSREFDFCQGDADCASPLICREVVKGASLRCTRACSTSSQCMTGTRCTSATGYCAFDDDGEVCSAAGQCNGSCAGLGYCTSTCSTALDCPGGWGCVNASGGVRACVRLDQLCGGQSGYAACITSQLCDNSLLVSGCTMPCSSALDCPQRALGLPAWQCSTDCVRPYDIVGAVPKGQNTQWACSGSAVVNLCADALTFDIAPSLTCPVSTSVPTSGPCVQSCRYAGGCGYGWACVGVGDTGSSRIGVCVQTGFGEVGQACTANEQCLFGLCQGGKCSRDCTADGICPTGYSCVAGGGPAIEGQGWRVCL